MKNLYFITDESKEKEMAENTSSILKKIAERKERLEYFRQEIRAERISQGELCELQSLAQYIDKDDVELLEPAGVPEFEEKQLGEIETAGKTDAEILAQIPY